MDRWQPIDVREQREELTYHGDPADVLDALAELLEGRPWWHTYAACRGLGATPWFPRRGDSTDDAKAVCSGCSVREDCLESALRQSSSDDHGVWGGTSARERKRLRRATHVDEAA